MKTTNSPDLETLHKTAHTKEIAFETILRAHYPRADRWTYYRAAEKTQNGTADKWDREMAENTEINAAHAEYIRALHAFYAVRDGNKGFLGSRGL